MNMYYYSLTDGNKVGDQPVNKIMKTVFFGAGLYKHNRRSSDYVRLTHISRWDYDMLDAFGVEVVTSTQFVRMDKVFV